ncbi:hypothetical protein F503_03624 [Ophiostoma piceae UAMH 11346]|uniref:Uncharacterized protein n=1 Tax=Ophiostoma piceae (strain UAMH 11346) TaxID=1262450 RepID=S3BVH9_OPHP1|nr:hypothetical protein F503_03624 [Ophiostoma piceae UAMH 11346]
MVNVAEEGASGADNGPDVLPSPGSPAQSAAALQPARVQSQALTINSADHHWLLKLPPRCWQRLAQYVDDSTIVKLSKIHRVFAHARFARLLRHKKKAARLAEKEEGATFVASRAHRFMLSPCQWHGSQRYPKACLSCYRIREPRCFPKVFSHMDVNVVASDMEQVYKRIIAEMAKSEKKRAARRSQSVPLPAPGRPLFVSYIPVPVLLPGRPLFVPYIPVPAETRPGTSAASTSKPTRAERIPGSSYAEVCGSNTFDEQREDFGLKDFHRCCLDCAVNRDLLQPGERVVAMDGTWRWVCGCRQVHFGSSDGRACDKCHDVPF